MFSKEFNLPNLKSPIVFSSGEFARQAHGSIVISSNDTVVLMTACMSSSAREGASFFPLTVDYQEKNYAMGKIPGGFIKREGRPKDGEMLIARLIDRPLRPLFPEGLVNEVQIVGTVLCSDQENDPDILAVNGASCALLVSDIPFDNPVGAVRVCKLDGEFVANPTYEQRAQAPYEIVVVGTEEKVVMIEGEFKEVDEAEVNSAITYGQEIVKKIVAAQREIQKEIGKEKREVELHLINKEVFCLAKEKVEAKLEAVYGDPDKKEEKKEILNSIKEELIENFKDNEEITEAVIGEALHEADNQFVRAKILKQQKRPDGRAIDQIRNLEAKASVLPRTHGSALFTRGQTQSLSIVTLGTAADEQTVETLAGRTSNNFMLHYSFPPFSVGEVKFMRGPSRREIGHGALAEKSIINVIPDKEQFPYTVRVVSEVLESNGSSSMATVCAASLALMDAGVPIKEQVAGIAMGIITDKDDYQILTDIAGLEDHCGDMDFKVAGTKNGISAIQLDVKNKGLTLKQIEEILTASKKARETILKTLNSSLEAPRQEVSKYAPKIETIPIQNEKIGELIGPGGKNIRRLQKEYNCEIEIDDEAGRVSIIAADAEDLKKAVSEISLSLKDVEVGEIYQAKVVRIANFGAFCDIGGGKSGLLHVSELSEGFVKDIHEHVKEGDVFTVKVKRIDDQGKIALTKKSVE